MDGFCGICLNRGLAELSEILDGANHLAGVGVLVVVPGNNLNLSAAVAQIHDHGLSSVKQGAVTHADNVGGDDLVLVVAVGLGSGGLHGSVDLVNSDSLGADSVQDGGGAGGSGDTLCSADQLAVQLGDNQADRLSSTGGVGNDVDRTSAGAAQVALSLGTVQDHLIAGVSMDGAHNAGLDGSQVVQSLSHGSQAVGGAGSGGDDGVLSLQGLVVYVVNDGGQVVASGSRDNDLLGAGVDVSLSLSLGGVETGALQNNVDTQLAPGQLGSVGLSVDGDLLAVDNDVVLASLDSVGAEGQSVCALSGVVLQQVSQHLGRGQVVDSDNFVTLSAEHLTESQTADTAKTINSNFNRHWNYLLEL